MIDDCELEVKRMSASYSYFFLSFAALSSSYVGFFVFTLSFEWKWIIESLGAYMRNNRTAIDAKATWEVFISFFPLLLLLFRVLKISMRLVGLVVTCTVCDCVFNRNIVLYMRHRTRQKHIKRWEMKIVSKIKFLVNYCCESHLLSFAVCQWVRCVCGCWFCCSVFRLSLTLFPHSRVSFSDFFLLPCLLDLVCWRRNETR